MPPVWPTLYLAVLLVVAVVGNDHSYPRNMTTNRWKEGMPKKHRWTVPCSVQYANSHETSNPGCIPKECSRVVIDDFITPAEVTELLRIVDIGMAYSSESAKAGGPTIMDLNTGYLRDTLELKNIYSSGSKPGFTAADFAFYKGVIERIHKKIKVEFGVDQVYFTAPTFVTREVGNGEWKPHASHDVYWQPHVDKNNTRHYDYSGLLYLADHGEDFDGGMFQFIDGPSIRQPRPCLDEDLLSMGAPKSCAQLKAANMCDKALTKEDKVSDFCPKVCGKCSGEVEEEAKITPEHSVHVVEPMKGRLVMFSSGMENMHHVKKVHSGTRFVLSMWFTCSAERHFKNFLDGKHHSAYSGVPNNVGTKKRKRKHKRKRKRKRKREL